MFEFFDHTADLGLRIRSDSLESLFAEAAQALFSTLVDLEQVQCRQVVSFRLTGSQHDYLLFDWLNELLFAFDTQHLLLAKFAVRLEADGLSADAEGEPWDPQRHRLLHEVKAITYHGLRVVPEGTHWLAEVVLDI